MKRFSLLIITFVFLHHSFAQVFQSTLNQFTGNFVPERIHIHFDKTSYSIGDTVWFKLYLLQGISPVEKSKSVYIDWTDEKGKLISRTMAPILSGTTFGQIIIPDDYASSLIHVKAYTKWMLNFDHQFLYNKDLRIVSNKSPISSDIKTTFSLFPEGGNLVAGTTNKVAFKAEDQYGRPAKVSAQLLVNGKPEVKLESIHDEMGFFMINPVIGSDYKVEWKDESGLSQTTALPKIEAQGVVLKIADLNENKTFDVTSTIPNLQSVHVIGTMFSQPVFNITRELKDGNTQGVIPVGSLPTGIMTITVFDEQFHPLAERITFINNQDYSFQTEMEVAHWGLNKRARNEIEITVPDNLVANLSVSVTDNDIDYDTSTNIISDLLLSSELKGKIYNPAFYFENNDDSTQKYLDLVMLTNGWRKIAWEDLAKGELPAVKFPPDTTYQTVNGRIFGATSTQLASIGNIVLIINQDGKNEWLDASVNRNGTFSANNFMLFDTATIYYQPPKEKSLGGVTVQFMEDRLPTQSVTNAGVKDFLPNPDTSGLAKHANQSKEYLDELAFFKGKVLEDITITAPTKSPEEKLDELYTSGLFSGGMGRGFDLRDDPSARSATSIFQYLQGRVAGVMISMTQPPTITWRGGTPALFLDEMQVDANALENIPVTDIAYVKVLNPPFLGAAGGGANGAIAIYTRKGGDMVRSPDGGLSKNTVTGYSVIRQFYSPYYDINPTTQKDLRTTLYWNPEVTVNPQNRKVTLKFFNNDVTEAFRVVIEGMSSDGRLTKLIQTME